MHLTQKICTSCHWSTYI